MGEDEAVETIDAAGFEERADDAVVGGGVAAIDEPDGALGLDDDGLAGARGRGSVRRHSGRGAEEVETKKWPPGRRAKPWTTPSMAEARSQLVLLKRRASEVPK